LLANMTLMNALVYRTYILIYRHKSVYSTSL
jgi:hypothetical protein